MKLPKTAKEASSLCESLLKASKLGFNPIFSSNGGDCEARKSINDYLEELKDMLDVSDNDSMDIAKEKLLFNGLSCLFEAEIGVCLKSALVTLLNLNSEHVSIPSKIAVYSLLFEVADQIVEEFCFNGNDLIMKDFNQEFQFSLNFCHIFMLLTITINQILTDELDKLKKSDQKSEPIADEIIARCLSIQRSCPIGITSLFQAFLKQCPNCSHIVLIYTTIEKSILKEFIHIAQTSYDIPSQVNIIDVCFRIGLLIKSKKAKGVLNKSEIYSFQSELLHILGYNVTKTDLKTCSNINDARKRPEYALFTARNNIEYKILVRKVISKLNEKTPTVQSFKILSAHLKFYSNDSKICGSVNGEKTKWLLVQNKSRIKKTPEKNESKQKDVYFDVNKTGISFYTTENDLVSIDYSKLSKLKTSENSPQYVHLQFKLDISLNNDFGSWFEEHKDIKLQEKTNGNLSSNHCYISLCLEHEKEVPNLLELIESNKTSAASTPINKKNPERDVVQTRMSGSVLNIFCTGPNAKYNDKNHPLKTPVSIEYKNSTKPKVKNVPKAKNIRKNRSVSKEPEKRESILSTAVITPQARTPKSKKSKEKDVKVKSSSKSTLRQSQREARMKQRAQQRQDILKKKTGHNMKAKLVPRKKRETRAKSSKIKKAPIEKKQPKEESYEAASEYSSVNLKHQKVKQERKQDILGMKPKPSRNKSFATNLSASTKLTHISYGTRADLVKDNLRRVRMRRPKKKSPIDIKSLKKLNTRDKKVPLKIKIPTGESEDDSYSESDHEEGVVEEEEEVQQGDEENAGDKNFTRMTISDLKEYCYHKDKRIYNKYFDKSNRKMWPAGRKRQTWKKSDLIKDLKNSLEQPLRMKKEMKKGETSTTKKQIKQVDSKIVSDKTNTADVVKLSLSNDNSSDVQSENSSQNVFPEPSLSPFNQSLENKLDNQNTLKQESNSSDKRRQDKPKTLSENERIIEKLSDLVNRKSTKQPELIGGLPQNLEALLEQENVGLDHNNVLAPDSPKLNIKQISPLNRKHDECSDDDKNSVLSEANSPPDSEEEEDKDEDIAELKLALRKILEKQVRQKKLKDDSRTDQSSQERQQKKLKKRLRKNQTKYLRRLVNLKSKFHKVQEKLITNYFDSQWKITAGPKVTSLKLKQKKNLDTFVSSYVSSLKKVIAKTADNTSKEMKLKLETLLLESKEAIKENKVSLKRKFEEISDSNDTEINKNLTSIKRKLKTKQNEILEQYQRKIKQHKKSAQDIKRKLMTIVNI